MRRLASLGLALAPLWALGCSCGSELAAGGPTPYRRCAMMEPPSARDVTVGSTRLEVVERTITVHAGERVRIAIARGPAGAGEPLLPALDLIEAASPALLILMGDLGDGAGEEEASIAAMVEALRELSIPVLLLAGGRDRGEALRDALPSEGALLDLSGVREVRIGALSLLPLPGAPLGRHAVSDDACGIGEDDVAEVASALGEPEGLRLLLSYYGPATGDRRTAGIEGHEAGSPLIAAALSELGARGGLYALPEAETGRPFDGTNLAVVPTGPLSTLHLVVPRLLGPASERSDGSRQGSGVAVLEVSSEGVAVLEIPSI